MKVDLRGVSSFRPLPPRYMTGEVIIPLTEARTRGADHTCTEDLGSTAVVPLNIQLGNL